MTVAYKDGFKIADTRKSQPESPLEQYCVLVFFASGQSRVQCTLFFYKNLFYKNVEAGIGQNFKNMPRTYPGLDFVKNVFILSSYL